MARNEHQIYCGDIDPPARHGKQCVHLRIHGQEANVVLKFEDISKRLLTNLDDLHLDLLEIAMYVYAADSAISRGTNADVRMGKRWRRSLRFKIPVRNVELWSSDDVCRKLIGILGFMSDDDYTFEFERIRSSPPRETCFEFGTDNNASFHPNEIILFSGGLDSFAGTVETLTSDTNSVALVSHRSSPKIESVQHGLVRDLCERVGTNRIFHVPVRATLQSLRSRDDTHRSRSFLFAALGAVTAQLFGINRINFFENGVMSLNLPPVEQVVGARATRTTHPKVIRGLNRLFEALFDHPFEVRNPYIWCTRAEVVKRIADCGFGDMIRHTVSCTRIRDMTKLNPHCGLCWQCLDRRFSIFAAGLEDSEPAEAYKVALFEGERPEGRDREMALSYVRLATDLRQIPDVAFFEKFGEASRIVDCFDHPANVIGERIYELYQRHAKGVCDAFDEALKRYAAAVREQRLSPNCLLSLVARAYDRTGRVHNATRQTPFAEAFRDTRVAIAIDETGRRVILDHWGTLTGNSVDIFGALAKPFRKAVLDEVASERFDFMKSDALCRLLKCDEQALRQQISRCRKKIETCAIDAGVDPPGTDSIIENHPWYGYRLNPDHVRIVAPNELVIGTL